MSGCLGAIHGNQIWIMIIVWCLEKLMTTFSQMQSQSMGTEDCITVLEIHQDHPAVEIKAAIPWRWSVSGRE
jgi:hypothetical protein